MKSFVAIVGSVMVMFFLGISAASSAATTVFDDVRTTDAVSDVFRLELKARGYDAEAGQYDFDVHVKNISASETLPMKVNILYSSGVGWSVWMPALKPCERWEIQSAFFSGAPSVRACILDPEGAFAREELGLADFEYEGPWVGLPEPVEPIPLPTLPSE